MADTNRNTFMRPDTLFGVCEAVGQDFGINPLWLRLAIVPGIFFAPGWTIGGYLVAGLFVLASRVLFPAKSSAPLVVAAATVEPVKAVPAAAQDDEPAPLALAA